MVCFMIKSGLPFLVSEKSRNMYRVERVELKINQVTRVCRVPWCPRHAGRIAKSAILKMCRRGSAWCGVRLKGFWLIKL